MDQRYPRKKDALAWDSKETRPQHRAAPHRKRDFGGALTEADAQLAQATPFLRHYVFLAGYSTMAATVKRINLEELWPELESGVTQLITNLNEGFSKKRWMELYSYVYLALSPRRDYSY
jgi:hypothetical protein